MEMAPRALQAMTKKRLLALRMIATGSRVTDIAAAFRTTLPAVGNMLRRLERDGMASRAPGARAGWSAWTPTAEGLAALANVKAESPRSSTPPS